MVVLKERITRELLPFVTRPGQYIGGEYNQTVKDWDNATVKMAFLFPDTYEIGMSFVGMRILYHVVNSCPRFLLERSFAPLVDMEEQMRKKQIPLFTWESGHAVADLDVVGFTLQYEMSYSNILNMLDLAGIPLLAKDRKEGPLVVAGGPGAFNPEPIADFFDLFMLGEGEELLPELLEAYEQSKAAGESKRDFLARAAQIPGIYVPSLYQVTYLEDGTIGEIRPLAGAPAVVYKRVLPDMDLAIYPDKDLVPLTQVVHDRLVLEVMRGCTRGCRFCQAGVIYRPVREKTVAKLIEQADALLESSGYEEIGVMSLSTADYSCVNELIGELLDRYSEDGVGVSLPSLRVDAFSVDLAEKVQKVRKSGLTFAPEAGTQRMRNVINKGVTEEHVLTATKAAFSQGWTQIKLYFMIGLPTETKEDLDGIIDLAVKVLENGKAIAREKGIHKPLKVSVSVSSFVPKSHTPFQWFGQNTLAELKEKQHYLKERAKQYKNLSLNYHQSEVSFLEAAFSRGDRRLGQVLLKAWQLGCKFDGWTEHFKYQTWLEAFAACGYTPEFFAYREMGKDEVLPWQHLSCGASEKWLWHEWQKALAEELTADCRHNPCSGCGVCQKLGVDNDLKGAGK